MQNNLSLFIIFFIFGLNNYLIAQTNLSSKSLATAQTYGVFIKGIDAANWNPASLGYKYKKITSKKNKIRNNLKNDKYAINILKTTSLNHADSISIYIKKFLYMDSLFVNIKKIKINNEYNIIIDDIINKNTATFYLNILKKKGFNDSFIEKLKKYKNSDIKKKYIENKNSLFHLELMNWGLIFLNSSLDANWINTYILNGSKLGKLDDDIKNDMIGILPDKGLMLNPLFNYRFGFRYNKFSILFSPDIYGEFFIPKGLFDLAFWGNEISKSIDLNSNKNIFQATLPINISYGSLVNIPILNNFSNKAYFGISIKYLAGIAYIESIIDTLSILPNTDHNSFTGTIKTRYSLGGYKIETNPNKSFSYSIDQNNANILKPSGSGTALDIGFIIDINEQLTSSIVLKNLFGQIKWNNNSTYKHHLNFSSNISTELNDKSELDSVLTQGIKTDKNININSFKTKYPSALIISTEYSLQQVQLPFIFKNNLNIEEITLASNIKFGFNNILSNSKIPKVSFASDIDLTKHFGILAGISFGGYESLQWGTGIHLNIGFLNISLAYSEFGGILTKAKGFGISSSTSIVF